MARLSSVLPKERARGHAHSTPESQGAGERPTIVAPLPCAAGLQAGLHVAAGLGGDDAALLDGVVPGADDLQVQRPAVAVLVQGTPPGARLRRPIRSTP